MGLVEGYLFLWYEAISALLHGWTPPNALYMNARLAAILLPRGGTGSGAPCGEPDIAVSRPISGGSWRASWPCVRS